MSECKNPKSLACELRKRYMCFFDGACEPVNPGGHMGIGAAILDDTDRIVNSCSVYKQASVTNSNNVAEYSAFIWVLETLISTTKVGDNPLVFIFGDSRLVVEQINRNWRIKGGLYKPLALRALDLYDTLCKIASVSVRWIPREENAIADKLSKAPMVANNVQFTIQPNL